MSLVLLLAHWSGRCNDFIQVPQECVHCSHVRCSEQQYTETDACRVRAICWIVCRNVVLYIALWRKEMIRRLHYRRDALARWKIHCKSSIVSLFRTSQWISVEWYLDIDMNRNLSVGASCQIFKCLSVCKKHFKTRNYRQGLVITMHHIPMRWKNCRKTTRIGQYLLLVRALKRVCWDNLNLWTALSYENFAKL